MTERTSLIGIVSLAIVTLLLVCFMGAAMLMKIEVGKEFYLFAGMPMGALTALINSFVKSDKEEKE